RLEIGGDDGRHSVVAQVDEPEEGVDLFGIEVDVAQLVDDHGLYFRQLGQQALRGVVGQGRVEFVEQILGVVEAPAITAEASLTQQAQGDSGLAGAGVADQQDVLVAAQEVEAGEAVDLCLADT